MKKTPLLPALVSLATIFSAEALADAAEEVRCHEIAFSQSVEHQDFDAFSSFIDADARFVGASVTRGREEITKGWSVFFAANAPDFKWRPQIVEVIENGTLALSRGPYRLIVVDAEGNTVEHWGTFNSIWRKQIDGSWKVVFDAGNESDAAPSVEIQAFLDQDVSCP